MAGALIRLAKLSFAYSPDRPVLRELDFSLEPGERIGLTGPNGSGKSTLLKLLMGLVRPDAGQIEILGAVRTREADFKQVRREVGLVFQDSDTQLFCPTVYDDVAFGPLNLGLSAQEVHRRVEETLETLGLSDYARRITYQLSHGEKRMVALATILSMRPKVILLDEPTAGLDPDAEARLTEILVGLPQDMIVVTHNRAFIAEVATRALYLHDGRLHEGAENADGRAGVSIR